MAVYLPGAANTPVVVCHKKRACCAQCCGEYAYEVVCLPTVRQVDADAAVPCPTCGWVQEHMIAAERRRMYPRLKQFTVYGLVAWGFLLAFPLFVFGVVMATPAGQAFADQNFLPATVTFWIFLPLVTVFTLGFWFCRRSLIARYDPNRERDDRR